eukprot:scaffold2242_cov57-Cyclotella_meneghiniana.AAC.7
MSPSRGIGTSNMSIEIENFCQWVEHLWSYDGHTTSFNKLIFEVIYLGDSPHKNGQQEQDHTSLDLQQWEESNGVKIATLFIAQWSMM